MLQIIIAKAVTTALKSMTIIVHGLVSA